MNTQTKGYALLKEMDGYIMNLKPKKCLICTTELMQNSLKQALKMLDFYTKYDTDIRIKVVESEWLGGNILLGDLMVTDDYISVIKEFLNENPEPLDLVFIPRSGFGAWKRDLRGKPVVEIERSCGVPVVLLNNELIYF